MSASLSIALKTFKFQTLFVALVGTIDAGATSGKLKGSRPVADLGGGMHPPHQPKHNVHMNNIYFI